MPTVLQTLEHSQDDWQMLYDTHQSLFRDGECYAFAMALNRGLDWPMIGLIEHDVVRHAGVRMPDGRLFDIRGPLTEEEFSAPYVSPPYIIRDIESRDMYDRHSNDRTRAGAERLIERAKAIAEKLWPDLPWRNSFAERATTFADELEALCRKHHIWIRGSVPGDPPRLYLSEGDEGGFKISQCPIGTAFTLERYFE